MSFSRNDKISPAEKVPTNLPTSPTLHELACGNDQQENKSSNSHCPGNQQHGRKGRSMTLAVDENGQLVRQNGLSYLTTLVNFLKSLIVVGFLSLPFAFRDAGLWAGLLLTILFAFLNCVCMMKLVNCAMHQYRNKPSICHLNFGDLARCTCANSFKWIRRYQNLAKLIVNLTIVILQFGFCSTYYLFLAVSMKEICEQLTPLRASTLEWLLLIFVPMCLFNFIRTLRFLAVLSSMGNLFLLTGLVFILQLVIRHPNHSVADLPGYNNFDGLVTASGVIIFTFEAQTIVLPMENQLKRPAHMLGPFGVLSAGILLASLVYSSVGFFGYVAYGPDVQGSITLNFPQHQISSTLVKLAICVSVLAAFMLQMYVNVDMLWDGIRVALVREERKEEESAEGRTKNVRGIGCRFGWQLPASFRLVTELAFRVLLVTICFLFAAAVPNLERIIPLVGISIGILPSFVFPALLDLLTFVPVLHAEGRFWAARYRLVQNLLLVLVGIFGMAAGLRANIRKMMTD